MGSRNGVSTEKIEALTDYAKSALFTDAEKVALEYADAITETRRDVDDELFARMQRHYDDDTIAELTMIIAWENASSRFNRAFRIPSQGFWTPTRAVKGRDRMRGLVIAAIVALPVLANAGGSNYAVAPGARPALSGKISEWPVPTPQFARDPAPGPDGAIYISVMFGNKIARFDPRTRAFKEWDLPAGARPHGLLVDRDGQVWYTGNGNGTIGHLDPGTGKVIEHKAPSGGDPHTLVIDDAGVIWFTVQSGHRIGRLDTRTGVITEYKAAGNPYGIALDREGNVWFCQLSGDRLGRLDPKTGTLTDMPMERDSRPRRMATAPDGSLWVTQYGNGKLVRVDPVARKVVKEYALPAGRDGGPYAVTVDAAGAVWANEIKTDTVVRLDPKTDQLRVFALPSKDVGIRKMIVDADGRLWYMGSHNGRLGVIE